MVKAYELLCVGTVVVTVGNSHGRERIVIVRNGMVCCRAIVNNVNVPKLVMSISPHPRRMTRPFKVTSQPVA